MVTSTTRVAGASEDRQARHLERREARRRRLERAALELFAARGYQATAVEDVVARARTSKSAFYELFSSKEDCLGQLLARRGGALVRAVTLAAAEGGDPQERIRRAIRSFVGACLAHAPLARLLLVESVGVSSSIEVARHALHGRFADLLEAEVREAAAEPFYADVDPALFGQAVVGAVSQATGHFLAHPGGDPEALAAALCRIFAPEPARG
ncbi:MAG: TetR/AcrR family transcriptional regulator [Candidatus Dormibacteraceae bacterium]